MYYLWDTWPSTSVIFTVFRRILQYFIIIPINPILLEMIFFNYFALRYNILKGYDVGIDKKMNRSLALITWHSDLLSLSTLSITAPSWFFSATFIILLWKNKERINTYFVIEVQLPFFYCLSITEIRNLHTSKVGFQK